MCIELLVLIDESDVCPKDEALHLVALHLAQQLAHSRDLAATSLPEAHAEFLARRTAEIEAKLRAIIAIEAP